MRYQFKQSPRRKPQSMVWAARCVLKNARRPLSVTEVRDKMRRGGFDFSHYRNHLASLHTVLKRLVRQGEAEGVE